MRSQEILDLKFYSNDFESEMTVSDFLRELFLILLLERESFNSKRPFGNSGWDGDLIKCFIQNGLCLGSIDSDGYIDNYDNDGFVLRLAFLLGEIFI